ncbi:MAG: FKBP-type peptidyl-prolyl cis-trans isomerase [Chitinophagaceae bacterium]|nr:MAG: FKBP-type peptidyl-prolyl cis-trans isomerase [Chitinophagaceae bacterium]
MKRILSYSLTMIALVALTASCSNTSFKKTKSGLLYKIISSDSKDSVVKPNQWLKLNFVQKLNDSLLQTSYGKSPVYVKIPPTTSADYSPMEIFALLKNGDSAVAVMLIDSLLSKGLMQQMPPFMKKGDKINWGFKVVSVFDNDSLYTADQKAEYDKDAPRREKAEAEEMAKMKQQMKERRDADEAEMEKSGEAAKGIQAMQAYLQGKNIQAQQVGKGTFVVVKQQGTGAQAGDGKYVTVTYSGRFLRNDSTFDAGSFTRRLGQGELISGMEEGLAAFKQGGKGVLYIPGFRAYGANPQPGSPIKPFDPLIFDVEVTSVSDTTSAASDIRPGQR